MTDSLFNSLVGPVAMDQIAQYAQGIFGMYSPIPALRPQTNRPLPDVVSPNFNDILSTLGVNSQQGAPPVNQNQQMTRSNTAPEPVTAMPLASFQMGTPYVPQTGNYQLHQGEAVVPAQQNMINQQLAPNQQFDPNLIVNKTHRPGAQVTLGVQGPGSAMQDTLPQTPQQLQPPLQPPQRPVTGGAPAGAANPLQQALMQLQKLLAQGGPMGPMFQNLQQQQLSDVVSQGQQNQLQDMRANMGARGLGGSGLQFGLEQNIGNDAMSALTQGRNQIAMGAAQGNFNGLSDVASRLIGGSLGAGQFGLQQAQFNQNQSQSMFDQLLAAIRNTFANPATQAANTTNVAFV
jgi:hypothetical protein